MNNIEDEQLKVFYQNLKQGIDTQEDQEHSQHDEDDDRVEDEDEDREEDEDEDKEERVVLLNYDQ